jgi:hypothetical protein
LATATHSIQTTDADEQQKFAPGQIAPSEGTPNKQAPPELGPNNENLEKINSKLVGTMRQLVLSYREEGIVSRRHEIRRIRQSHLWWQGIQYGYFSGSDWQWHMPFGTSVGLGLGVEDPDESDTPRYQFVTNIYQAFGLSFIALMSSHVPTPEFYPQSAQNEQDITTAAGADDVRKLIEKNNRPKKLLSKIAWLMWTDGKVGGYVRYVADGQRFGWADAQDMESQTAPLGDDAYVCPECGTENTPDVAQDAGFGMTPMQSCESCGSELTDDDMRPAQQVQVPRVTNTRRVPKGQEVISIIPGLEFHTPPWADEMDEFPYLQWNLEVHIAKLKAAYPVAASRITASGPVSADDTFARASRVSVKQGLPSTHPGDALANLVTFSRTWIRPWCFWLVPEKEDREQLLKMFPEGCYVAFAGETYCESRNEAMDDSWRVLQAMPGDGQNRPSVGDSMIQVQQQYNDLSNIEAETYEFGIPPILADAETIDFDALENTTAEPATWYPVKVRAQESIADKVLQLQPSTVPADMIARRQELMGPIGQFLTGLTPTVFGSELSGNDTARAYELAREMAMGRITLFWIALKTFYAEIMLLGVECFRKNRPEDIEITDKQNGQFKSKWLRLADLKGNIEIYDDPDETYPELPSQVRAMLTQLLEDPIFGAMITKSPANMATTKTFLGLRDFEVPGEEARIKAMRDIETMLEGQGPVPGQPQVDPMSGAVAEAPPESSIPVDPLFDDAESELAEYKRWANSDAGQSARAQQPAQFADISAHAAQLQKLITAKAGGDQQKPPSESINFKDLPPDGQAQMAGQAGIKLDPADLEAKQQQDKQEKAAQFAAKMNQGPGKTAAPPA